MIGRDARWDPALFTQKEKAHPDAMGTDRAIALPRIEWTVQPVGTVGLSEERRMVASG